MQRLSSPTETLLTKNITRNSPIVQKRLLRRRPQMSGGGGSSRCPFFAPLNTQQQASQATAAAAIQLDLSLRNDLPYFLERGQARSRAKFAPNRMQIRTVYCLFRSRGENERTGWLVPTSQECLIVRIIPFQPVQSSFLSRGGHKSRSESNPGLKR